MKNIFAISKRLKYCLKKLYEMCKAYVHLQRIAVSKLQVRAKKFNIVVMQIHIIFTFFISTSKILFDFGKDNVRVKKITIEKMSLILQLWKKCVQRRSMLQSSGFTNFKQKKFYKFFIYACYLLIYLIKFIFYNNIKFT